MNIPFALRSLITIVILLIAIVLAVILWRHYMYSPWTREGRVRADVVTIAPDVSGLVASVAVKDNAFVKKGDLLLSIDKERYKLALAEAESVLAAAHTDAKRLKDESQRRSTVGSDVVSKEGHEQASAAALVAFDKVKKAEFDVSIARLNLDRTDVYAPVDGYVTNLSVFPGDYAHTGGALVAVIDSHSFWVCGYFEETKLSAIHKGNKATIELAGGGASLNGVVGSIARGIGEKDNPTGKELLVDATPTYNWVRLAQRIPVRIDITSPLPEHFSAGMSCTVVVHSQGAH